MSAGRYRRTEDCKPTDRHEKGCPLNVMPGIGGWCTCPEVDGGSEP